MMLFGSLFLTQKEFDERKPRLKYIDFMFEKKHNQKLYLGCILYEHADDYIVWLNDKPYKGPIEQFEQDIELIEVSRGEIKIKAYGKEGIIPVFHTYETGTGNVLAGDTRSRKYSPPQEQTKK